MISWHRRGNIHEGLTLEQSQCLVRACPTEDKTNGFFVAYFERHVPSEATKKRNRNKRRALKRKGNSNIDTNNGLCIDGNEAPLNNVIQREGEGEVECSMDGPLKKKIKTK